MTKLPVLLTLTAIASTLAAAERHNIVAPVRTTFVTEVAPESPAALASKAGSTQERFGGSVRRRPAPVTPKAPKAPADVATAYAVAKLGVQASEVRVANVVPVSKGASAVHLVQVINGLEVANARINVNVAKDGRVLSHGDSWFRGARPSKPDLSVAGGSTREGVSADKPAGVKVDPKAGFEALAKAVSVPLAGKKIEVKETTREAPGTPKKYVIRTDAALSPIPVEFKYVQVGDKLELVYDYRVERDDSWYNGFVNAQTGKVEQAIDWVSDLAAPASYNVLPLGFNNPLESETKDITAGGSTAARFGSPLGWHDIGNGTKYTDTRGNNVYAQENLKGTSTWLNNARPDGGADLDFKKYKFDFTKPSNESVAASTVQLFYLSNQIHDILYNFGFDEVSGNFQENNFNKGGRGGDAIIANAQDGAGTNNANFATPPDGSRGRMRMYVWTTANPTRDGVYDTAIVYHEYGHGVSNRLTGGPANSNCLGTYESAGMGEGWSDTLAYSLNTATQVGKKRDFVYPMSPYAMNNQIGIRKFPYSTDMTVNPSTYKFIGNDDYKTRVHRIGEVWAVILYEVYWNLRDKLGFEPDMYKASGKGNHVFLQLVLDGMKLQPCNPTLVQARDAILLAELNLTGGDHRCDVWKGFAKRGLGFGAGGDATKGYTESYELPPECL